MGSRSKTFIVGQSAMSGKKSDAISKAHQDRKFKPVMKHTILYVISNNWVLVLQVGNFLFDNKEFSVARFGETVDCKNSLRVTHSRNSCAIVHKASRNSQSNDAMQRGIYNGDNEWATTPANKPNNLPPFIMVSCVQISCQYATYTAYILMRKWKIDRLGKS